MCATVDAVRMKNICMSFAGNVVLNRVDYSVRDGEIHALMGANGAGKSTLIKVLNGVYRQRSGCIEIHGKPVRLKSPKDAERLGLAFVHQELNVCPDMTVAENIFIGNWATGKYGQYDRSATNDNAVRLQNMMGIELDPNIAVRTLRTAEKQIVEILKTLARDANIVVFDEPTSSLNEGEKERLFQIIARLKKNGVSIIFISHFLEDVMQLSDRVTVLKDGVVNGVFENGQYTKDDLVCAMMGVSVQHARVAPVSCAQHAQEVLKVEGISRHRKFSNISFAVHSGDIVGVCGLLGAGKTEIARAIFGLEPLDAGKIVLNGLCIERPNPARMIAHGVALLTEERKAEGFVPLLSIRENETLSIYKQFQKLGTINRKYQAECAKALSATMMVKMTSIEQPVYSLSGGNQQKVVLAKCLSIQPRLFLLDEPTRGVDILAKSEIYKILRSFAKKGTAVIIFSSEIDELIANCSRIFILKKGSMTDCLDSLSVSKNELLSLIG